MPRGDGTGPAGAGPMTGRGAGYCAGFNRPGYANGAGGFAGYGFGRGRGFRRMYYATGMPGWMRYGSFGNGTPDFASEKETLRFRENVLKNELEQISKRLEDLEEK